MWVNMRGSLWKCSQLQCKLATTEESRGLEIQNQLLDDMKAEFQEFPGRRVYTDVEREGIPPSDADKEEDRTSALMPTLPQVTFFLSLIPRAITVFERRFKVRTCQFRQTFPAIWTVMAVIKPCLKISEIRVPDILSREMEENVQNVRALDSDHPVNHPNTQKQLSDDPTPESNQTRERTIERADEPPTQRPRLENAASSIRWS